jgi:predicted HicB family RNase H-like nuclease
MMNYTYRAQWSVDSGAYVGTCLEFPKESAHAPTPHEAVALIQATIGEVVASYLAEDVDPPPSITDRHYGGTFVVRTSAELHGRLMVESVEQGVSLNHWVVLKLAGRNPAASLDPWF